MPDSQNARVAVYLDFDNIVISWYDRVHGRNSYGRDRQRILETPNDPEIADRLSRATIDVGAIIDYAASFGTLVLTRAYADWSSPVNAVYRSQLVARAVDLVQLFPAAAYAKNGADIRLAVDAVEDMFRLPDLTHVVIVAGDSDYVPLAQRCKRLGRYVVGIGVAGSTAKSLAAACDEFEAYDSLPGVPRVQRPPVKEPAARATPKESAPKESGAKEPAAKARSSRSKGAAAAAAAEAAAAEAPASDAGVADGDAALPAAAENAAAEPVEAAPAKRRAGGRRVSTKTPTADAAPAGTSEPAAVDSAPKLDPEAPPLAPAPADIEASLIEALGPASPPKRTNRRASSQTVAALAPQVEAAPEEPVEDPQEVATRLLERALRLGHDKDDTEWLHSSAVKTHMRRMDPSFSEKALGFRSFSDFLKEREAIAELEETGHVLLVRLRE
ncbi:NYN domain-containing protein [Micromonospora sp. DT81.3]|uniref:NYN domain-containing protein n=1 Tax=Micromonospora sp. DT81.3 TaxID=3416523 RepID=UPI003CEBBF85